MIRKILLVMICCLAVTAVYAQQEESSDEPEESFTEQQQDVGDEMDDEIFWSQEVDTNEEWGYWLKEIYKPYSDAVTLAALRIVAAPSELDLEGKTSDEIMEELTDAFMERLKDLEDIKPPIEFANYHKKVVEMYRLTINADPRDPGDSTQRIQQLKSEVDREMTDALKHHNVPERVIYYFLRNN